MIERYGRSNFVKKIEKWSNQNVFACFTCGTCSAACPFVERMSHLPSQIMKLLQMENEKKLLTVTSPWICASCIKCSVMCPRGVRVAEIMEALRLYQLRQGKDKWDITLQREELKKLPPIAIIANFRKMTG
ncbi:MAG: 4Fe-4S dicluster domain-containing protein [Candidatus Hodarchaeales archaeon]|jgi:heterodisulfide reductase subunit C